MRDAFDLKKTVQEVNFISSCLLCDDALGRSSSSVFSQQARYFAEAVGAGMGKSMEGFMKTVFPGSKCT